MSLEMFTSVASEIQDRIKRLESRLAQLEGERDSLDARLGELRQSTRETTPFGASSTSRENGEPVKFFPFSSKADSEFFRELGKRKLNEFKLSDAPVEIFGSYMVANGKQSDKQWLEVRASSFAKTPSSEGSAASDLKESLFAHERVAFGTLMNMNTTEQFKAVDKKLLVAQQCKRLLSDIESGQIFETPGPILSRFLLLTFADLKKHKYLYWFAFPALTMPSGEEPLLLDMAPMDKVMPGCFEQLSKRLDIAQDPLQSVFIFDENRMPWTFSEWKMKHGSRVDSSRHAFAIVDPSPSDSHPSWLLRNLITVLVHEKGFQLKGGSVKVACIRDLIVAAPSPPKNSQVLTIKLPSRPPTLEDSAAVGWEHNEQDKLGPRLVDLSAMLDETKLIEAACNLNLSLMKWRAFPELNEKGLANTRVLLLGSGTLGCAVARSLMGWGFRYFTFVDSGKVSYSNPVRQSLFVSSDCSNHGRFKAEAAAEMCLRIYPGIQVESRVMSIPMPGHQSDARSHEEFVKLQQLIVDHDVVCLLTDTRESRWLPTLLGAAYDKIVLNAALGFDSFVVMRHGSLRAPLSERLGCYFCTDVVAPKDSTRDRSLDQQCTVTRPGCAPIAGSLLVEMMVNVLHHPKGVLATSKREMETKLGVIPHQIRGYLSSFQNDLITGQAFSQCTACSEMVVERYSNEGFSFIKRVLDDPDYLETLTGLDKLKGQEGDFVDEDDDFSIEDDDEVQATADADDDGEDI